jgi:hypothetical protein
MADRGHDVSPAGSRGSADHGAPSAGWAVRFLTSVKLAVGLIAYLVVMSVASTLVPGWGNRFFTSVAFLVPAVAFFANLTACSLRRFVRELRRPHRRRHGPDLLHLGLIVLLVGSAVSYRTKGTGSVTLAPGRSVNLPDGATLTVTDFRFDRYPDGRPKDWVSTLRIAEGSTVVLDGFELRVNRPLRRGRYSFYQSSYDTVWQLALRDDAGAERSLDEGERAEVGGVPVLFMSVEGADGSAAARAVIRIGEGDGARVVHVAGGDRVGTSTVAGVHAVLAAGIMAVADPGWPVVATALALIAVGTALTFFQKLREAA